MRARTWRGRRITCVRWLQDALVSACGRNIEREYEALVATAAARGPGEATVTTADVWDWVSQQTGSSFDAHLVNQVLVAAGADDDQDVALPRFTHVVVHMFEAFFATLDRHRTGYVTQARHTPGAVLTTPAVHAA